MKSIAAAIASIVLLSSQSSYAAVYVAGTNDGGTLYQFSTSSGLQNSVAISGINNVAYNSFNGYVVVGTSEGDLSLYSSSLSFIGVATGGNLGTVLDVETRKDNGDLLVAYTSSGTLGRWSASGAFQGQYGTGFTSTVRVAGAASGNSWATYEADGTTYSFVFDSSYNVIQSNSPVGAGRGMTLNTSTTDMWFADSISGAISRYTTTGLFIDSLSETWLNPHLASSATGIMWLASDSFGGSLSAYGSDGAFLGTYATTLGNVVDLVVDPDSGDVVLALTNGSPSGDLLRFDANGNFLGSLGSNLNIVELTAGVAIPEPGSYALIIAGVILVSRRVRRRDAR